MKDNDYQNHQTNASLRLYRNRLRYSQPYGVLLVSSLRSSSYLPRNAFWNLSFRTYLIAHVNMCSQITTLKVRVSRVAQVAYENLLEIFFQSHSLAPIFQALCKAASNRSASRPITVL